MRVGLRSRPTGGDYVVVAVQISPLFPRAVSIAPPSARFGQECGPLSGPVAKSTTDSPRVYVTLRRSQMPEAPVLTGAWEGGSESQRRGAAGRHGSGKPGMW
jgi:hypothetical protein